MHSQIKPTLPMRLMQLRSNHGLRQCAKIGLALFVYFRNIRYIQKVSEEGVRKKIKFVVKLILF